MRHDHCNSSANPALRALVYVLQGAIHDRYLARRPYLGLSRKEFEFLVCFCFPADQRLLIAKARALTALPVLTQDEFDDLVELFMEHRADEAPITRWVAHAMAAACMGDRHLWQDMGLPHRTALNTLIATYFPQLHAQNTANMKWKKFFYRQLCEREGILICKAPRCDICPDFSLCFSME